MLSTTPADGTLLVVPGDQRHRLGHQSSSNNIYGLCRHSLDRTITRASRTVMIGGVSARGDLRLSDVGKGCAESFGGMRP